MFVPTISSASVKAGTTAAPTAGVVAQNICGLVSSSLGSTFNARFGSENQCEAKAARPASLALTKCNLVGQPGSVSVASCLVDEEQSAARNLIISVTSTTTTPPTSSVSTVTNTLCALVKKALGTSFTTVFSSANACVQKLLPIASMIVATCSRLGSSSKPAYQHCISADEADDTTMLVSSLTRTSTTTPLSAVASAICAQLAGLLGSGFSTTYGSLDACASKYSGAAQNIVNSCNAASQVGTAANQTCLANSEKEFAVAST